jgi:hypothetical protein
MRAARAALLAGVGVSVAAAAYAATWLLFPVLLDVLEDMDVVIDDYEADLYDHAVVGH